MYAGDWQDRENSKNWEPIAVLEKSVRGTISNRLNSKIANDPLKVDAEIDKPNLQTVDTANLNSDTDTLKVSFTLRVHGALAIPSVCTDPAYQEDISAKITDYIEREQFSELAKRYPENLANGRFLWRNRVGAEQIEVQVQHIVEGKPKQIGRAHV